MGATSEIDEYVTPAGRSCGHVLLSYGTTGGFNRADGVTPQTLRKAISERFAAVCEADYFPVPIAEGSDSDLSTAETTADVARLHNEMRTAARDLEFEHVAALRGRIHALETRSMGLLTLPLR